MYVQRSQTLRNKYDVCSLRWDDLQRSASFGPRVFYLLPIILFLSFFKTTLKISTYMCMYIHYTYIIIILYIYIYYIKSQAQHIVFNLMCFRNCHVSLTYKIIKVLSSRYNNNFININRIIYLLFNIEIL